MRTVSKLTVLTALFVGSVQALAATATLTAPSGGSNVQGGMTLIVDPYGAFSSAVYQPTTALGAANTTRYSAVMLKVGTSAGEFLDQDWLGSTTFDSTTASSAFSYFDYGSLYIELTQTLTNIGPNVRLTQTYDIFGPPSTLTFTRYMDTDLLFNGNDSDGGASSTSPLVTGEALFAFDSVGSGTARAIW